MLCVYSNTIKCNSPNNLKYILYKILYNTIDDLQNDYGYYATQVKFY